MNVVLRIVTMATIAAAIGWSTNLLAIKMIFRPLYPLKIPIIGWNLQGIIPKRRDEIAKNIGKMVEEELISINDIVELIKKEDNKEAILSNIKRNVNRIVDEKIPSIVPSFVKKNIFSYISRSIDEEADKFLDSAIEDILGDSSTTISIANMVEDKINSFDLLTLEEMILSIANKELKHIEILGGILGLIIGIVQGILMLFIS
ncbi:MAG: DUF445 family protein [Clostridiales bacterium]|nr:DUF445 family protein [Clostridiales bacterium]